MLYTDDRPERDVLWFQYYSDSDLAEEHNSHKFPAIICLDDEPMSEEEVKEFFVELRFSLFQERSAL